MSPRHRAHRRSGVALPIVLLILVLAFGTATLTWAFLDRAPSPQATDSPEPTPTASPEPEPEAEPEPEPEPEPLPDAVFWIGAVGDVLPHATVTRTARTRTGYDFTPMLEATREWSEGVDLALCNLESPLIPPDLEPTGYPLFGAPEELGHDLADLGWDGCSTGNNHTLDRGYDNVVHTLDVLDDAGMGHMGSARSQAEADAPQLYELEREGQQITVAQIGGTDSTNGIPIPQDAPWAVTIIDTEALIDQASSARQDGADLVIATLHWGAEYIDQPREQEVAIAQELADSGEIDLIIGHHPHVPQPFALLEGGPDDAGMWVAYSLGNFISNQDENCCVPQTATGLFMTATVVKPDGEPARVTELEWTAMTVDRLGGQRVYPLSALIDGERPESLALSEDRLQIRERLVREVMETSTGAEFAERTEAPERTGEKPVVHRRGE